MFLEGTNIDKINEIYGNSIIDIESCKNDMESETISKNDFNQKILSKEQVIAMYENEFSLLEFETRNLYLANEEMLKFDSNDYDLIVAREENLLFINTKLSRMKDLQIKFTIICPTNPLCNFNIYGYFWRTEESKKNELLSINTDYNINEINKTQGKEINITFEIDL